jgi:hypothetical protein
VQDERVGSFVGFAVLRLESSARRVAMKRAHILEEHPKVLPVFLDDEFDEALVGVVCRPKEILPCYGYAHCVRLLKDKPDVEASWAKLTEILAQPAALLMPVDRGHFWDEVAKKRLVIWEALNPAIAGTVSRAGASTTAYHYPRVLQLIQGSLDDSEGIENGLLTAVEFFQTKLASVDFGPQTPYFLHPI